MCFIWNYICIRWLIHWNDCSWLFESKTYTFNWSSSQNELRNKTLGIMHRATCTYCHVSAVCLGYLSTSVFFLNQNSSFLCVVSQQNCVDIAHCRFVCVLHYFPALTLFRLCMYQCSYVDYLHIFSATRNLYSRMIENNKYYFESGVETSDISLV